MRFLPMIEMMLIVMGLSVVFAKCCGDSMMECVIDDFKVTMGID